MTHLFFIVRKCKTASHRPVRLGNRAGNIFALTAFARQEHDADSSRLTKLRKFCKLAAADICPYVGSLFFLYHTGIYFGSRRFGKTGKLIEGGFALAAIGSFFHQGNQNHFIFCIGINF